MELCRRADMSIADDTPHERFGDFVQMVRKER